MLGISAACCFSTNRVDDIDRAIVSRCIAFSPLSPPQHDDRQRIWAVMSNTIVAWRLTPADGRTGQPAFPPPPAATSKALAKLVAKYRHHKAVAPTLECLSAARRFGDGCGGGRGGYPPCGCPFPARATHLPSKTNTGACLASQGDPAGLRRMRLVGQIQLQADNSWPSTTARLLEFTQPSVGRWPIQRHDCFDRKLSLVAQALVAKQLGGLRSTKRANSATVLPLRSTPASLAIGFFSWLRCRRWRRAVFARSGVPAATGVAPTPSRQCG